MKSSLIWCDFKMRVIFLSGVRLLVSNSLFLVIFIFSAIQYQTSFLC
jgi:hypothetical protein